LESLGLDDAADFPRLESMGIASSGISSLGPRTCAEDAQCNAAYNQHSADGRRDTLIMAGLYADVNVAGVKAVAFGLGDGNEQRCDSEHDQKQSSYQQCLHSSVLYKLVCEHRQEALRDVIRN
jgi:hypothetical protein